MPEEPRDSEPVEISWDNLREPPVLAPTVEIAPATSNVPEALQRVTHALKACMTLLNVPYEKRVVRILSHEALDAKSWHIQVLVEPLGMNVSAAEPTLELALVKVFEIVRKDLIDTADRHDRQAAEARATMRKHMLDASDLRVLVGALGSYVPEQV